MKIYFLILVLIFTQSCTSSEKKQPLNYLNGENYNHPEDPSFTDAPLFIPVGKNRITKLSGTVVSAQGLTRTPLKLQKVVLKKDDKILGETVTGLDGSYYFSGIFVNGNYQLKVANEKYQGNLDFVINSYSHKDLTILATPQ
jgi:hypothetical protein